MKVSPARAIRDALAYPSNESFEQALGRAMRRHGGTYQEYVDLITEIREIARSRKTSLREAARVRADQP